MATVFKPFMQQGLPGAQAGGVTGTQVSPLIWPPVDLFFLSWVFLLSLKLPPVLAVCQFVEILLLIDTLL